MKDLLKEKFPGILFDEPLAPYSTFKIGGPADYFYRAKATETIPELIKFATENQIPVFIIGAASNILFDDEGFRGLIIKIETENIEINGDQITADAGVLVAKLIEFSIQNSLSGLEKWVGLPGTIGGAVRGNAGCNGLETKDLLLKAKLLDPKTGKIKEVDKAYFEYSYRESKLKKSGEIVLNATFQLKKSQISSDEQRSIMDKIRVWRKDKQPIGFTTGSFFKNPNPENPAGSLLDQCGLKGKTIGKAQISSKHANFFLNLGGASSKDIIKLAKLAKEQVQAKFNLNLEEEVQIISPFGKVKL